MVERAEWKYPEPRLRVRQHSSGSAHRSIAAADNQQLGAFLNCAFGALGNAAAREQLDTRGYTHSRKRGSDFLDLLFAALQPAARSVDTDADFTDAVHVRALTLKLAERC
jgi:hypothetical protein